MQAGETPVQAAIREAKEELHLCISPDELIHAYDYTVDWQDGTGLIISMYACRVEVPEGGFTWDAQEVNDVKVMPFHTFRAHVMNHNDETFGKALDHIENEV